MREFAGEIRPAIHLGQKIGDVDVWQIAVQFPFQGFGLIWHFIPQGRNDQDVIFQADAVKLSGSRTVSQLFEPEVQGLLHLLEPGLHVAWNIQAQLIGLFLLDESRLRHQIFGERAVGSTAFHPNVAGAQPVPQRGQGCDFIKPAIGGAGGENLFARGLSQMPGRKPVGQGPVILPIDLFQRLDRRKRRIMPARRMENKSFEEARRELAQARTAPRRQQQRA